MPEIPEGMVPARYIGEGVGLKEGTVCYNVDGSRRQSNMLSYGDTILMQDEDIYGKTMLFDPKGIAQPEYVGLGKVVKDINEHRGKSEGELRQIGYQWHLGRTDFKPIEPLDKILAKRSKKKGPEKVFATKESEQA